MEEQEIYFENTYIICWDCYNTFVVGHMNWITLECMVCGAWIKNHLLNRMVWKWLQKKNLI
jgi:ribosomal protein S27E